jgi:hypothetical protein
MKVMKQNKIQHECFIEKHYKIDHEGVPEKLRTKFVTIGKLFEGKPICVWCLTRLALVADFYGYSQQRSLRGNAINVDARVSQEDLIKSSPLKKVFEDIDVADLKYQIDRHLFELEPQVAIQPPIESQIDRIRGIKTVYKRV